MNYAPNRLFVYGGLSFLNQMVSRLLRIIIDDRVVKAYHLCNQNSNQGGEDSDVAHRVVSLGTEVA